jgi:hypothetical protein
VLVLGERGVGAGEVWLLVLRRRVERLARRESLAQTLLRGLNGCDGAAVRPGVEPWGRNARGSGFCGRNRLDNRRNRLRNGQICA